MSYRLFFFSSVLCWFCCLWREILRVRDYAWMKDALPLIIAAAHSCVNTRRVYWAWIWVKCSCLSSEVVPLGSKKSFLCTRETVFLNFESIALMMSRRVYLCSFWFSLRLLTVNGVVRMCRGLMPGQALPPPCTFLNVGQVGTCYLPATSSVDVVDRGIGGKP
jgi:hypothetical protein